MSVPDTLIDEIKAIRNAVRVHRDQLGDYRCWVDDHVLYDATLPNFRSTSVSVPSEEEFHSNCVAYYEKRQNPLEERSEIPLDSRQGALELRYAKDVDDDLTRATPGELEEELRVWRDLLDHHREKKVCDRTFEDDLSLYLNLPEKKLPITLLPEREDFLGKNCPAYNHYCQSHMDDFRSGAWNPERTSDAEHGRKGE